MKINQELLAALERIRGICQTETQPTQTEKLIQSVAHGAIESAHTALANDRTPPSGKLPACNDHEQTQCECCCEYGGKDWVGRYYPNEHAISVIHLCDDCRQSFRADEADAGRMDAMADDIIDPEQFNRLTEWIKLNGPVIRQINTQGYAR